MINSTRVCSSDGCRMRVANTATLVENTIPAKFLNWASSSIPVNAEKMFTYPGFIATSKMRAISAGLVYPKVCKCKTKVAWGVRHRELGIHTTNAHFISKKCPCITIKLLYLVLQSRCQYWHCSSWLLITWKYQEYNQLQAHNALLAYNDCILNRLPGIWIIISAEFQP